MLRRELGQNDKIVRIEQSVQNLLDLQHNLRSYLHDHAMQKEDTALKHLIEKRLLILEKNYPNITFMVSIEPLQLHANREAVPRIIDNL
ncbi:MAG: hypothetical protein MUP09_04570 [Thiovulaceae bacterium]|nr:hypothetical protein [Sulfurimonadaceae bacterium]